MSGYPHAQERRSPEIAISGNREEKLFTIPRWVLETDYEKLKVVARRRALVEALRKYVDLEENPLLDKVCFVKHTMSFYLKRGWEIEFRDGQTEENIEMWAVKNEQND